MIDLLKIVCFGYIIGLNLQCGAQASQDLTTIEEPDIVGESENEVISETFTVYDFEKLSKVKSDIDGNSEVYRAAYEKLIRDADKALTEGPFSVMQKTQTAPSGDKHDYLSLAPYWWPDPDKADGLPWIRRDGEVNPMTRGENVDDPAKDKMIGNVGTLSLAYFFSGDNRYAAKAKELLRVWFVDEATRMNPNLNYAQGVPGSSEGRGFGVIEFAGISHIITAIEILELENQLDSSLGVPLRKCLGDYLDWLQTSELGLFEKTRENNHGTLYDIQEVSLLLFFDKIAEAKSVLETVIENRISAQIEPDGSQPDELKRTKALTYSILNLSGLTKLAFLGRKKGVEVDLWSYESATGDMKKAYAYLAPFLNEETIWPYQQLGSMENALERLRRMFVTAGSMLQIEAYCELEADSTDTTNIQKLLYPCNP